MIAPLRVGFPREKASLHPNTFRFHEIPSDHPSSCHPMWHPDPSTVNTTEFWKKTSKLLLRLLVVSSLLTSIIVMLMSKFELWWCRRLCPTRRQCLLSIANKCRFKSTNLLTRWLELKKWRADRYDDREQDEANAILLNRRFESTQRRAETDEDDEQQDQDRDEDHQDEDNKEEDEDVD